MIPGTCDAQAMCWDVPMADGAFWPGFFDRADPADDREFYAGARLVTHIDERAILAVGELYDELRITGDVLDLMGSWVSHFRQPPRTLTVLGMNPEELAANAMATARIVHDLNAEPRIPVADGSFDDVVCCVSVDYLTHPVEVFRDVARALRPGGRLVCTFSNRVFPTKAIRGWLLADEVMRRQIVAEYFRASQCFGPATAARRTPPGPGGDPLDAVWATTVAP
jgi:SAM-dependent methyltransferase